MVNLELRGKVVRMLPWPFFFFFFLILRYQCLKCASLPWCISWAFGVLKPNMCYTQSLLPWPWSAQRFKYAFSQDVLRCICLCICRRSLLPAVLPSHAMAVVWSWFLGCAHSTGAQLRQFPVLVFRVAASLDFYFWEWYWSWGGWGLPSDKMCVQRNTIRMH